MEVGARIAPWAAAGRRDARGRRTLAAAVLAVAGCLVGGATGAAAGDDTAQAGQAVDADKKILRVGTSGDYAPFSFATSSDPDQRFHDPEGFDIDLARRFARDRGYRVRFVPFVWPDLARDLEAGRFDVAMSGITLRPKRSLLGRFTVPVAATHAVALAWKGSGVKTFADLDVPTRRIAVNAGGHLEQVADQVFRRARVVPLGDNAAVRMALLDGTFDAVVTDNYEERVWTRGLRGVVRIAPLTDDRKACLLPADRRDLAIELDRWLLDREKDGTLAELRRRHFGEEVAEEEEDGGWFSLWERWKRWTGSTQPKPAPATAAPLDALASAVIERLALMPLVYETKKRLGLPIRDDTREAAVLDAAVAAVRLQLDAAADAAADSRPTPADGDVRAVFQALMAMGRDAQQALADLDARRHPPKTRPHEDGEEDDGQAEDAGPRTVRHRDRVYDLKKQLRPAIGRITDKIATILLAMDRPVPVREARRSLGNALASHQVHGDHVAALAEAVSSVSSRRPAP